MKPTFRNGKSLIHTQSEAAFRGMAWAGAVIWVTEVVRYCFRTDLIGYYPGCVCVIEVLLARARPFVGRARALTG